MDKIKSLSFCILVASLAAPVSAAPATDQQLQSYVWELNKEPQNLALREKIIRLALTLKPKLPVQGELAELEGYVSAAMSVPNAPDYAAAIQAYEKALALAPWCAACYLGQAKAQEGLSHYADAQASLRLYLLAAPNAKDSEEVYKHIGALRYKIEKGIVASVPSPTSAPSPAIAIEEPTDVLGRFRQLATGSYMSVFECGRDTPASALHKRERMACNQAEYNGDHWHKLGASSNHEFRVRENKTIEFWAVSETSKHLELVGTPKGSTLGAIQWAVCEEAFHCTTPAWVRLSDNLDTFTVSLDHPAQDKPADPNNRYAYTRYRRE